MAVSVGVAINFVWPRTTARRPGGECPTRTAAAAQLTCFMTTLKFKTTINCANCVRAVTPALNEEVGANNWQVDTTSADKVLTITAASPDAGQVVKAVEAAGFEIRLLAA